MHRYDERGLRCFLHLQETHGLQSLGGHLRPADALERISVAWNMQPKEPLYNQRLTAASSRS
jgi:hypothetical protein